MITEKDLQEAIAECQGTRNPNANTCIMLAAFLTIQKELFGKDDQEIITPTYSYAPAPVDKVTYESDTEFSQVTYNMDINTMMEVIDELMTTLSVVNPRLYAGVIRKLQL